MRERRTDAVVITGAETDICVLAAVLVRRAADGVGHQHDPVAEIDRSQQEAASLSRGDRWSEEVALAEMPELDAIVCGSVAVTRDGRRGGKGEGYSDLEFAILRELGHPPVPVATTVTDPQVIASVPRDPTDQPLLV